MNRFLASIALCVGFIACVHAEPIPPEGVDSDAIFRQADELYMSGSDPEQALILYDQLIRQSEDEHYITLSQFKTAVIYEQQLLEYRKAMLAYEQFIQDHPSANLSQVAQRSLEKLHDLQEAGALDEYQEYKRLHAEYTGLMQNKDVTKKQKRLAAKKIYQYAVNNSHKPYRREMFLDALSATGSEKLFVLVNRLIRVINEQAPDIADVYDLFYAAAKMETRRFYMARLAELYLLGCFLFTAVNGGFRRLGSDLKEHRRFYTACYLSVLAYFTAWYVLIVRHDIHSVFDWTHLAALYGLYTLLIPFASAFYHAFQKTPNRLRNVWRWSSCALLGICGWILYGYHYDYLWIFQL